MTRILFRIVGGFGAAVILVAGTLVYAQTAPTPKTTKPTVNLACLQNVVERRDNSIIATVDGYHATIKTALETRRDGLKTAFGTGDRTQRQSAIRNAWNTYKATQRKAKTTLRDARNAAWQKFTSDRKACGSGAAAEDKTPSGVDAEL